MTSTNQAQELAHALSIARPRHVLTTPELVSNLRAALNSVKVNAPRISVLSTQPAQRVASSIDVLHVLQHGDTQFNRPQYAENEVSTELAFICFSSGTSGLPKGVKLSHGNIVSNVYMHSIYLSDMFTPSSVFALVVPFFHILGLEGFTCLYILNVSMRTRLPEKLLKCVGRTYCCVSEVRPTVTTRFDETRQR
jgi:4-coumarate--CoA ligase